jgi:predicted extracellular nuclease
MSKFLVGLVFTTALFSFLSCDHADYLSIAFYNVENLFDTIDDEITIDEEYLSSSSKNWDKEKYQSKLSKLSDVISTMVNKGAPDFLGLCEVENKLVLEDLIATPKLKKTNYSIVHYESIDPRGIDVAALYNPLKFSLVESGTKRIDLSEFDVVTRDILWVKLKPKEGKEFYFIVNHWPSRWGGKVESEPKRMAASYTLAALCAELQEEDSNAQLIIMGDFNDEPMDSSIRIGLKATGDETSNTQLFNAMAQLKKDGLGSYNYRGNWNMLDQVIINGNLRDGKGWDYISNSAQIMSPEWMRQHSEKYEGYPLRTFGGSNYLNGYSDHFPVYILLHHDSK